MKRIIVPAVILVALSLCARSAETNPQSPFPSGPGVDIIGITFNQVPVENGLTFDRSEPHYAPVTINGKSSDAWASEKGITPNLAWQKSFRFHIVDARFQKGGRPAVDLEVTAYLPKPGSIYIQADTVGGNRRIFDIWNQGKDWETYRIPLDDAFFGSRPDAAGEKFPLQGYDFSINSPVGPFYLRSVRLAGYDTQHNVVWSKCLKVDNVSLGGPGDVFAWQRAPGQKLTIGLQNLAHVPAHFHYRIQLTGYDGKALFSHDDNFDLNSSAILPFNWTVDASSWPLGPYDGQFDVFDESNPGTILLSRHFRFGVMDTAAVDKARAGEFLYGLDVANAYIYAVHTPTAFAYFRLMGVDILRGTLEKGMEPTPENVGIALGQLAPENVQSTFMYSPPNPGDPTKTEAELKEKEAFLEETERLYGGHGPGKICYYELGNEPDLPRFYPGSTTDYVRYYEEMLDAIKRGGEKAGLKDSDSVVTTGGLSFAGMIGPIRAAEILQKLDPAKIDAIAYHGHGPGIEAERHAFERVYAVAVKDGIADHPFIETESGYSGHDQTGLEEQARTAVEKMVYAQSQHEPLFMFFRLFMEGDSAGTEGGYGMTDNLVEPHPSVFAYRNMVERLRHESFERTLDIVGKNGGHGIDGYVFSEHSTDGTRTGRKTIVLFAETPVHSEIRFRLDAPAAQVASAELYDMYGNATEVPILPGNIATVPAGIDPVFLSWTSPGEPQQVAVAPPLLSLAQNNALLVNATNPVNVLVHNSQPDPLHATISLTSDTRVAGEVTPSSIDLTVPSGQSGTAAFQVKLQKTAIPLRLPIWWKIFTGVDTTKVDVSQISAPPENLPGPQGAIPGHYAWTPTNHLDFGKLSRGFTERRAAYAFAYLDAEEDMSFPCAASADWYMAWYANGVKVYDTIDIGNRGGTLADHTFDLPLKKGRNLIVAEVLSGSGGWSLDFGGPKERQIAVSAGNDPDHLSVTATSAGGHPNSLIVPVTIQATLPRVDADAALDDLPFWQAREPLAVSEENSVKNLWMKEPDSTKWYTGSADLSATVWLSEGEKYLELFVAVTDDKHIEATTPQDLDKGDAVRIVIADDAGTVMADATGGLIGGKPALKQPVSGIELQASAPTAQQPLTLYRWEIPKSLLASKPFRLSLSVLDNDSTFLKQTLDFGDVSNPIAGLRLQTGD